MSMPRVHARAADRFDLFLRQLGGRKTAPAFAETLELLIFVGTDKVAGDLPVARDGDWLALRPHAIAAKVAGELGSRDGIGRVHGSSLSPANIRDLRKKRKSRE